MFVSRRRSVLAFLLTLFSILVVAVPTLARARTHTDSVPQYDVPGSPRKQDEGFRQGTDARTLAQGESRKNAGEFGGFLGVYLGDVTEERARELKLPETRGALVGKVAEGSPGEKAGLRENDVLLSFNDDKIQNRAHFYHLLTSSSPGSRVQLEISRDGRRRIVSVLLGQRTGGGMTERERLFGEANALLAAANDRRQQVEESRQRGDEKSAGKLQEEEKELRRQAEERRLFVENQLREGKIALTNRVPQADGGLAFGRGTLGLNAVPLSEQLARLFNVSGTGVLITEVQAGELAERAGLRAGDCIVRVNGQRVSAPADLLRFASTGKAGETEETTLVIVRDRAEQTVSIKGGKR